MLNVIVCLALLLTAIALSPNFSNEINLPYTLNISNTCVNLCLTEQVFRTTECSLQCTDYQRCKMISFIFLGMCSSLYMLSERLELHGLDTNENYLCCENDYSIIRYFICRKPFTTIPAFGQTKQPSTLPEGRLGSTHKKQSYQPIGIRPSQRSASV